MLCSHCGMDLQPHEALGSVSKPVCQFCTYFAEDGFTDTGRWTDMPDESLAQAVVAALRAYNDNDPVEDKQKRPSQIQIHKDDVNDVIKMNGFVKDVLDVAAKQFPHRSPEAEAINTLFGQINTFTEGILLKAKRMESGLRTAPILFSKMESETFYRILDLAHRLYGKFMVAWFKTKAKKDWPAWRKIFYENAWHLGSFVRHGRPAKMPSLWLTGDRPPLEDDPFGNVPIGQER